MMMRGCQNPIAPAPFVMLSRPFLSRFRSASMPAFSPRRGLSLGFSVAMLLAGMASTALPGVHAQGPYSVAAEKVYITLPDIDAGLLEDGDRLGTSLLVMEPFPLVLGEEVLVAGLRGRDYPDLNAENAGAITINRRKNNGQLLPLAVIGADEIPTLEEDHSFGSSLANLGDLDGDGIPELAVGAPFDSVLGQNEVGAVYILFLDSAAQLRHSVRITNGDGGLPIGTISAFSRFGSAIASIDDLDGDGLKEVVVGAPYDQPTGAPTGGALYVLFLNPDGSVRSGRKVDPTTEPALVGTVAPGDMFGHALANLGFLGGGGNGTLAVGAYGADGTGRIHLLRFTDGGFVNLNTQIGASDALLASELEADDAFGFALANIGDLNGDGIPELGVTAPGDDDAVDGLGDKGALYILYLYSTGALVAVDKISETRGGFNSTIKTQDFFGSCVAPAGDLNNDGIPDLMIGARNSTRSSVNSGTFYYVANLYCRQVEGLNANTIGPSEVQLSWAPVPRSKGYLVQFRESGTIQWNSDTVLAGTLWGNDTLDPGETYDWRVFCGCGDRTVSLPIPPEQFSMPTLRTASLQWAAPGVVRLPDGFASGESISCWAADGRLLGRVQPSAEGLWTVPAAWRQQTGLRILRRDADGQALPTPFQP